MTDIIYISAEIILEQIERDDAVIYWTPNDWNPESED